jgi:hypothetical protein
MRIAPLSLLVMAALVGTPSIAALADPVSTTQSMPTTPTTRASTAATASDAEQYAQREAKDKAVANFQGGGETYIYIGGGVLVAALVIVLVLILI